MTKRLLVLIGALCIVSISVLAQNTMIKGIIVDSKGKPFSNAIISTTNNSAATMSNAKGEFTLRSVSPTDTLHINTMLNTFLIPINNVENIKITIGETISAEEIVDETINIGYQKIKKKDATINTNKITGERLMATGETSLDNALLKIMPSLRKGRNGMLIVRATQSLTQQGPPLYIVNGSPTGNANSIQLSEIESVEVLKDGSATAIYGTQGSNGVILINLK